MSDKSAVELTALIALSANIALVALFSHLRRETSFYVIAGAMMPGFVIISGIFGYAVLGFSLAEVFVLSVVIFLMFAGKAVQVKRHREYFREHYPAIRQRHKNYWKKRIRAEQGKGHDLPTMQRSGRLPGNDELLSCGYDESELTELGLLD